MTSQSLRRTLILIGGVFVSAVPIHADVIVQDASVAGDHYVYTLDFDDLATNTKFEDDKYGKTSVRVIDDQVNGVRAVAAWGGNAANLQSEIIYKFDFTQSQYRPTAVSFTDSVSLLASNNPNKDDDLTVTISYSTDGSTWMDLRIVESEPNFLLSQDTTTVSLSSPNAVYYKVHIAPNGGDGDGIISHDSANQWNRQKSDESIDPFTADFTLAIPEPGSLMLSVAGLGLMVFRRR